MANEFTTTDASAFLKEIYWPSFEKLWWTVSPTYDRFRRKSVVPVNGKEIYIPVEVETTQAAGWMSEGGNLPTPTDPTLTYAYGDTYQFGGQIKLTDKNVRKARTGDSGWIAMTDLQMRGLLTTKKRRYAWQVYGNGTGMLAIVDEAATGASDTTLDITDAFGLHPGMIVDIIDETDHASEIEGDLTITAVDKTSAQHTISMAATNFSDTNTAVGDYLVIANGVDKCMSGLDGIISASDPVRANGTAYLGIDRDTAAYANWKGQTLDVSGDLTEDHMANAVDLCEERGGNVSVIFCSPKTRRFLYDELKGDRRFTSIVKEAGAKSELVWEWGNTGRISIVADRNCTVDKDEEHAMYFVDESTFYVGVLGEGAPWITDGGGPFHWVQGTDGMVAGILEYTELICVNPQKNCNVYDISS